MIVHISFFFFSLIFSASATKLLTVHTKNKKHYLCTVYWLLLSYRAQKKTKLQTKKLKKSAIITSENPVMAPVPSVCVRVPHSPSIDSDKQSDSPGSPPAVRNKYHLDHTTEFATLAVRECVNQKYLEKNYFFITSKFLLFVRNYVSPHHCLPFYPFQKLFKKNICMTISYVISLQK